MNKTNNPYIELYEKVCFDIFAVVIGLIIFAYGKSYFGYGFDPTDNIEAKEKSGLIYYKDHGTGIEYIGNGGTLIRREYE